MMRAAACRNQAARPPAARPLANASPSATPSSQPPARWKLALPAKRAQRGDARGVVRRGLRDGVRPARHREHAWRGCEAEGAIQPREHAARDRRIVGVVDRGPTRAADQRRDELAARGRWAHEQLRHEQRAQQVELLVARHEETEGNTACAPSLVSSPA